MNIICVGNNESEIKNSKSFLNTISLVSSGRIFICNMMNSESIRDAIENENKNAEIVIIRMNHGTVDNFFSKNPEIGIKKKVLDLGLSTIRSYIEKNYGSFEALNNEISQSIYRAFFLFYSSAMPAEYEELFENRRTCILGKLYHYGFSSRDLLICDPWDLYWFKDYYSSLH
ncbi:hypothetical protein [Caldiplasma sukawensis]